MEPQFEKLEEKVVMAIEVIKNLKIQKMELKKFE